MSYIVFDLEWNQQHRLDKCAVNFRGCVLRNEIMQIGAVKLDENHEIVDDFFADIHLQYNTVLDRHVARVVGLTQKDMGGGRPFTEAIADFKKWCGKDSIFLTWGYDDVPIFRENLNFYDMSSAWLDNWYNAQLFFHHQFKTEFPQMALSGAMELLGITTDSQMHNALTDAGCTGLVCTKLDLADGISRYWQLKPAPKTKKSALKFNHVYGGMPTRAKALNRKDIMAARCPECGKLLAPLTFLWAENENKRHRLYRCEGHGNFMFNFKVFQHRQSKTWAVNKSIYAADEELVAYYLKKNEVNELVAASL